MNLPYVIESDDSGDKTYEIYSRLLRDRIIFLQGQFNGPMANGIVAQLLYLQSSDPKKDIFVYVNSPGGEVTSLYSIYDTMQYITPDIVTVGIGQVASAGSFILAAGTKGKRMALTNTEIMVHEFSGGFEGPARDIFNQHDHMVKLYGKMANHYAEMTGQPIEKIKEDMRKDYYMSAQEAVEYGLIDKVVTRL